MEPPASANTRRPSARPSPKRRPPLPDIDERLVMPETRYEVIDGKVEYVPPADPPHGIRHSKVSALLEAHVARGYEVAVDMLTRTSERSDMAPDASVFPLAPDPRTGGRQLEVMAFEVVSTEKLSHAAKKARALSDRGVRSVFAIDVERGRALVWSRKINAWEVLPEDGVLEDVALAVPLPVRALTHAASTDDVVARALLEKENPVLQDALRGAEERGEAKGEARGKKAGYLDGKIQALLDLLDARHIRVPKKAEKRIRAAKEEAQINAWLLRALHCSSVDDLFE